MGILGSDLFGGLVQSNSQSANAKKLANTSFAQGGYYALNFNDRASGITTLIACLVINNWDVYVEAYSVVAGRWAWLFFWAWWVCGVLAGLNLVTSVVIDAFVD